MAPEVHRQELTPQQQARWHRIRRLSDWLDTRFRLPGTTYRFGLDSILGVIPGIGDSAGLLLSLYILYEAKNLGVPPGLLVRMAANLGIDALVGTIPLLGDVFDVAWKANTRNLALLRDHYMVHKEPPAS